MLIRESERRLNDEMSENSDEESEMEEPSRIRTSFVKGAAALRARARAHTHRELPTTDYTKRELRCAARGEE